MSQLEDKVCLIALQIVVMHSCSVSVTGFWCGRNGLDHRLLVVCNNCDKYGATMNDWTMLCKLFGDVFS